MKPEAQRIAIAEACGWVNIERYQIRRDEDAPWYVTGQTPVSWKGPDARPWLPDFLNDLNAMHEAEKTLNPREQRDYAFELSGRFYPDGLRDAFDLAHASAAKRAEAFLKTRNLWTDDT